MQAFILLIHNYNKKMAILPEGHFPGPPEVPERDALPVVGGDDEPRVGGVELHRVEGLGALVRR